jgi:hypothetical protein
MMADLFARRNSMATADIVGELERMHRFYSAATWALGQNVKVDALLSLPLSAAAAVPQSAGRSGSHSGRTTSTPLRVSRPAEASARSTG